MMMMTPSKSKKQVSLILFKKNKLTFFLVNDEPSRGEQAEEEEEGQDEEEAEDMDTQWLNFFK